MIRRSSRPLALGIVAVCLVLSACGSDSKSASTTDAPATTVAADDPPASTSAPAVPASTNPDGSVDISVTVGTDDFETSQGARVVSVPKGATVTISLTDPGADQEYHLHGYDVEVAATKGQMASLSFTADQTGQFDLESHDTEAILLVIVVA
jgi:hypothetical protein